MSPLVLLVVLAAVALVAWRQLRARELKLARLWVVPALLAFESWHLLPQELGPPAIALAALGLVAGVALGVFRAGLYTIVPHRDRGTIAVKGSPWALAVWGVIVLFKLGARHLAPAGPLAGHLDTVSFALLLLALGMLLGTRGRMLYVYYQSSGEVVPLAGPADSL